MPIPMDSPPPPEGLVRSASELRAGDYVIYPGQGVHRVAGFDRMDIAGRQLAVVKLSREHDGATVIVPIDKVPTTGLRRVADRELVEDVLQLLAAPGREVELDWKERHRDIHERLVGGGLLGVAEIVKELHDLSQFRPPPPKEREHYEARDLLVHEMAISLGVLPGVAEDYVDFALTPPAGVKLPLKASPAPKPARWVLRRPKAAPLPKDLEELPGMEEMELEAGGEAPSEEAAPIVEAGEPERRKPSTRGKRVGKTAPKKRAARKRGPKKPHPVRVGKRARAKRSGRKR